MKVRNFDEKQVSNEDLKVPTTSILTIQRLFEKKGKLRECKFDRNEFGQFLGSATVVYEKAEDAAAAIKEYHGAELDEKILTVEYDNAGVVRVPKIRSSGNAAPRKGGKTLRVGGRRGGLRR